MASGVRGMARRRGSRAASCREVAPTARPSGQRLVGLTGCPAGRPVELLGPCGGCGTGWLLVAGRQGPARGLARAGSVSGCLVRAVGAVAGVRAAGLRAGHGRRLVGGLTRA